MTMEMDMQIEMLTETAEQRVERLRVLRDARRAGTLDWLEVDPEELRDDTLALFVDESARRELAVHRHAVEDAYAALVSGDVEGARRALRVALYPHGGCDLVAMRAGAGAGNA